MQHQDSRLLAQTYKEIIEDRTVLQNVALKNTSSLLQRISAFYIHGALSRLRSSCFLTLLIYIILYALCPAVIIPSDNTWRACGRVPWHIGPIPLLIIQDVQDVWLHSYDLVRRRRDASRCFVVLLDRLMQLRVFHFTMLSQCVSSHVVIFPPRDQDLSSSL